MPRWLTTLLVILLFLVLVAPNPVAAGNYIGNAVDGLVVFFRSAGNEVDAFDASGGATAYGYDPETGQVYRTPTGGIATGDGTATDAGDAPLLLAAPAEADPLASEALPGPSGTVAALPSSTPVSLSIPAIEVQTDLLGLGLQADSTMAVPQTASMAGWYRHGPTPGEVGPAVITGHIDWEHESGVFHDLRKLRQGDELTVRRGDGRSAVFEVFRVAQFSKASFPTAEVYGDTTDPELRLITCGGQLDRSAHNYLDNVVVFAKMVRTV